MEELIIICENHEPVLAVRTMEEFREYREKHETENCKITWTSVDFKDIRK